jgi:hypothetical protein
VAQSTLHNRTHQVTQWAEFIPETQWSVYGEVLDTAAARGIPVSIGGAFAVATYTGHWRNTKDLDLYVLPEHRDRMIEVLSGLGLKDYFAKLPYDRWWIYRAFAGETIVDVIWAMANHRAQIDHLWMSGPEINVRGRRVKVLPAEALLWDKLYIMQRDRCDWPDLLNLLYSTGLEIDWEYLLERMGDDAPLMAGALLVFGWVSPGRAQQLPGWVWERLGIAPPSETAADAIDKRRASLLDTRPWYGPDRVKLQPED